MKQFTRRAIAAYFTATLIVGVATLVLLTLFPLLDDRYPFLLFFGVVAYVASRGRLGPTILTIGLSVVAVTFVVIPQSGRGVLRDPSDWLGILLFLLVSSLIARTLLALHTVRRRVETAIIDQKKLLYYVRDVGHALTRTGTLQAILGECARATVEHLDGSFARIWTLDETQDFLELQASAGLYTHLDGPHSRIPVGSFKIGEIARDRRPHLTNSVLDDPMVSDQKWAESNGMKAFAGYPLIVDERLVGVMAMFSRHSLNGAALEMMESVATEIALGIERKRSEEQLRRQREWLRVTLKSIGDAMIATDTEGRITLMNHVAEGLTGWSQADAEGIPLDHVFRIIDESTRTVAENPATKALRDGTIVGLANHTLLIARDGTERAIDDSAAPILDEAGAVAGVVLIFRDVTERRESERLLLASEARKAAILKTSLDAIITIDEAGTVLEFNPAAERIFERRSRDVMGRELSGLIIPPALRDAHRAGLRRYRDTGEGNILGRRIEISAMKADGTEFPVELAVAQLNADGPSLFTAHLRDISDRKAFEKRRAARIRVTEILAESTTIAQAFPRILEAVGKGLGWGFGAFWEVDSDADVLRCRSVWQELKPRAESFAAACRGSVLRRGAELPGLVWESAAPVWIRDVAATSGSSRALAALEAGWRGAFAYPILSGERIVGIVEFFSSEVKDADPDILEMFGTLGGQMGLFLQRGRAEDALRAGDERLRLALHSGRMGTWEWDVSSGTVLWSPTLEEIHGLAPGTFPGTFEAYQSDMHPDDRPDVLASLRRAVEEGRDHHVEYRIILPDGSLRWIEARGRLFRDEAGAPRKMIGVCMDVTERNRNEADRSRLISIIEHSPNFIGLADDTQRVLFVNRAGLDLVGLTDPVESTRILDFFPEEERARVVREILPILRRDGHWDGETAFRNFQTGAHLPVMWNVFMIRQGGSTPPFYACVSTDISERKLADLEIRRREKLFHSLADSIPQLAWMADADGEIYWYNQRWYDYTGTTLEQVKGRGWRSVHDPAIVDRVEAGFRAAIAEVKPWEDTFPLRRHDGEMRWHLSRAQPVRDEEGRILHWFGTNTDITDRMRLEESLREADRRKDEFLATLAHELRNPLAPIRNALRLMKTGDAGPDDFEQERSMAERQVTHLVRLVEDLMDLSRINTGKIELRTEIVELAAIVRRAVEAANPAVADRGHTLTVSLPKETILVDADPTRLEQILWNLLNNAIKYTDPGGAIALQVEADDRKVRIHVRDTGLGIPPEILPTVFGMFVQSGSHRGHSRGGLGIGLNLVRNLVGLHGGSIVARSEGERKGSEFVVELPIASPSSSPAAKRAAPTSEAIPPRRRRVLVVDDNEDAAKSLARILTRIHGQEVRVAHDGDAALDLAPEFLPELILLDLGLPGIDGFEVARRLRSVPGCRDATIVALTGWGQEEDRQKSRAAGFDAHYVKPLDPDVLDQLLAGLPEPESA